MHIVLERRLQRRHQYQTMCSAEYEACGADSTEYSGATSQARSLQREAEADGRAPFGKGCEASASGLHK